MANVNGHLDRPLGVNKAGPKKPVRRARIVVFAGLALAMVAIGFAGKGWLDGQQADGDQIAAVKVSGKSQEITQPVSTDKKIAERPDLPIDDDGPGLRELTGSGQLTAPVITPVKRPQVDAKRQVLAYLPDPELVEKTSYGSLPVISADGLRPYDLYARRPDTEGNFGVARIVLIVGGLGISQTSTEQAIRLLPPGVTLAFAPYGNSLTRWMQKARKEGHELLIQVPMEPFGYPQTSAGEHSLLTGVEKSKNQANLLWTLGRITNYVGVMNFMGGKMLSSGDHLVPVFEELSSRGLMFVDDGSIRNSKAGEVSKSTGIPFTRAHLTIDSLRRRSAIAKRLAELETTAKRTGLAIGVATAFPESIAQIVKFLKDAKGRGLELTPVSAIASQSKG